MSFDVHGKTALVTGANRGIGRAIVDALIHRGAAKVYAAVRNLDSAQPLVDEHGDRIAPVQLDLAKPETIKSAAQTASDVQLVISNAGVLKTASPLDDHAIEALQFEMDINVYGLIRMAQAFGPVIQANGGGALVQLNSVASMKSFPDFATYCASKAAAYSITQALREKLDSVQVLSVHPGPIGTDMAHDAGLGEIAEPPAKVADGIIAALSSGDFHLFPDSMAQQIGEAYQGFAANIVEANLMEA